MKNHYFVYEAFLIILIFILCNSTQVYSQSPNIFDYGASYKVKVGDRMQYKYSIINNLGKSYRTISVFAENYTIIPINVTVNSRFTYVVTDVNRTFINPELVQLKIIYSNPGNQDITSSAQYSSTFLFPAFNNQTILNKYLNNTIQPNTTVNTNSYYIIGNLFTMDSKSISDQIYESNLSVNWKTGWLEFKEDIIMSRIGTILEHYKINRVPNDNLVNNVINLAMDAFTIISLAIMIAIPITLFIGYKKYSKSSIGENKISFLNYIKTKGKKNNKMKKVTPTQADKALELIDEILQENK